MEWLDPARAQIEAGASVVLVRVVGTRGSTPREAGATMLVRAAGVSGTIGGGRLEYDARAEARAMLETGLAGASAEGPRLAGPREVALGPALGQCCGGVVTLLSERFGPADRGWLAALAQAGPEALAVTPLSGGPRRLVEGGALSARLGDAACALLETPEGPALVERRVAARCDVAIFGGGHVTRALLPILAMLPFRVTVIEGRPDWIPPDAPGRRVLVSAAPALEVADLPPGTAVLVMTHDHALDLEIVAAALARPDLPFVGLIGSATKKARFLARLRARGLDDAALARLVCPIGIDGVSGKAPAIVAVAAAAQLLQRTEVVGHIAQGPAKGA